MVMMFFIIEVLQDTSYFYEGTINHDGDFTHYYNISSGVRMQ
jgi:hypothetical protein